MNRRVPLSRMSSGRTSSAATSHFRRFVVGFVGQSAISNTAVAALVTVLSFIWCIEAISFQESPHKRIAAQSYLCVTDGVFPETRACFDGEISASTPTLLQNRKSFLQGNTVHI